MVLILAIVQHDLKKLLAYHSIENIGIIGIGIGIGAIGVGEKNVYLTFAGFAGALLHTLNHSLFKSLLFYGAGTVYQAIHTLNIDSMGGLIKKMPYTAGLFLIGALAICGLPPFNGFISEFLIFLGLFNGIHSGSLPLITTSILSITGLVLIGGLALLCFTKAFGIIFLGHERSRFDHEIHEAEPSRLLPGFLIVIFIMTIGLFPQLFCQDFNESCFSFIPAALAKVCQKWQLSRTFNLLIWPYGYYINCCGLVGNQTIHNTEKYTCY